MEKLKTCFFQPTEDNLTCAPSLITEYFIRRLAGLFSCIFVGSYPVIYRGDPLSSITLFSKKREKIMPFGKTLKANAEARGEAKRKSMISEASRIHALVRMAIICKIAGEVVPRLFSPPPPPSRLSPLQQLHSLSTRHEARYIAPSQGRPFL